MSESRLQQLVRLEAARLGWYLWRNNSGAFEDVNGRWVRYGLANDSKNVNEVLKSSDLIGFDNTGTFVAAECKPEGWVYSGTAREVAQLNFIELVKRNGGRAGFITDPTRLVVQCCRR